MTAQTRNRMAAAYVDTGVVLSLYLNDAGFDLCLWAPG